MKNCHEISWMNFVIKTPVFFLLGIGAMVNLMELAIYTLQRWIFYGKQCTAVQSQMQYLLTFLALHNSTLVTVNYGLGYGRVRLICDLLAQYLSTLLTVKYGWGYPAITNHLYNVDQTSSTLVQHCTNVLCLLGMVGCGLYVPCSHSTSVHCLP